MTTRHKRWCFTLHDPTEGETDRIKSLPHKYIICGRETCPTTGRIHLQGYFESDRQGGQSMRTIKKHWDIERVHLEPALGTAAQNKEYCSKEHVLFENGVPSEQGARNDLAPIRDGLENNMSVFSMMRSGIVRNYGQLQYAQAYKKLMPLEWEGMRQIYWIWGPSGIGKSRYMWEMIHDLGGGAWVYPGGNFFDGYDGHTIAVFDDFRAGDIRFNKFLQITDRHPTRVEVKGSSANWDVEYVFVTSPDPPEDCFAHCGEALHQVVRRITHLVGPEQLAVAWEKNVEKLGGNTDPPTLEDNIQITL